MDLKRIKQYYAVKFAIRIIFDQFGDPLPTEDEDKNNNLRNGLESLMSYCMQHPYSPFEADEDNTEASFTFKFPE